MQSNEPLIVQAIEDAILLRRSEAEAHSEPFKSHHLVRLREYRKLLLHARGRLIQSRDRKGAGIKGTSNGNLHPAEVR